MPGQEPTLVGGPYTQSDDQGHFSFDDLAPGEYFALIPSASWSTAETSLIGSSAGRLNGQFPLITVRGTQAPLVYPSVFSGNALSPRVASKTRVTADQAVEDVDIRLKPVVGHRLVGRVSLNGEGIPGVFIRLMQPELVDMGFGSETAATRSGINGKFEFVGVPAGEYVIDIPLSVNEYTFAGGSMSFSYGFSPPKPPGFENATSSSVAGTVSRPGLSVVPVNGANAWSRTPVLVDDSQGKPLEITLTPAVPVTGRIVVEVDPQRPAPRTRPGVLWLEGDDVARAKFSATPAAETAEGTFAFRAVLPGSYWMRSSGSDWTIKSVVVDGQDRTHMPIEIAQGMASHSIVITVTNSSTELTGRVLDGTGSGLDVCLLPSTLTASPGLASRWMRSTRVATDGTYRFSKIPAGEYVVFAVRALAPTDLTPAIIASGIASAERIVLQWGKPARADLRVVTARDSRR